MNIVLVCGGRDFNDRALAYQAIEHSLKTNPTLTQDNAIVMSGGQRGADTLALDWAFENEWNALRIPAKWKRFNEKAGALRNKELRKLAMSFVLEGRIVLIALPGGRGTNNMVHLCLEMNAFMRAQRFIFHDYRTGVLDTSAAL